ncbi:MAG: site-2 protease family protein [Nanoarchaeota archaeon]|nr:site-2 protease family protein [Nanoarchaeota archaeon]
MNFIVYDIALLVIFAIVVAIFLIRNKKKLKREGLLFLYKADWGIKLINRIGKKHEKALRVLSYVSIAIGFLLMAGIFYLFGRILWIYIFNPAVVKAIKIPPILPLFPYLPQVFKLDFLPPFYFIYWIIVIAIVAITHEFSHGIFAAYNKVKIKKTGFGFFPFFLPVFLAAFVELDEKIMATKEKIKQMAILSAGAFANVITAVLFFFLLWGFFVASFTPAGVSFDIYSYSPVIMSQIKSIDNITFAMVPNQQDLLNSVNPNGTSVIKTVNNQYVVTKDFLEQQKNTVNYILLYNNLPAINAGLTGAISKINGVSIDSREKLSSEISKYSPGNVVTIETKSVEGDKTYKITLGENPEDKTKPLIGIGFMNQPDTGIMGKISNLIYSMKKPNVYYEPKFGAASFINDLLWWLVLISFSVALVNMLPVGIFDGGRFLFLAVWGITKDRNKAEKTFKFLTYLILLFVLVLMIFWGIGVFGKA